MPKRDFLFGISVSKDARAWQNFEILGLEIFEDGFGIPSHIPHPQLAHTQLGCLLRVSSLR
jgi:hypothetical protein